MPLFLGLIAAGAAAAAFLKSGLAGTRLLVALPLIILGAVLGVYSFRHWEANERTLRRMIEFGKRADTLVHTAEPFNAEPSRSALAESALTPLDVFYVRGHGPVPDIDPAAWSLRVGGLVGSELDLSLDDLRDGRFELCELPATLQCAGNRRSGLLTVKDIPGEEPWGSCATGTATWHGVRLADVLAVAEPATEALHVALLAGDVAEDAEPPQPYGASVPLAKAQRPEVLLAWSMNGEPLPAAHGGPLRVVVPGYIGARSVKWLERLELRTEPWDGFFQETVYRLLPPDGEPGAGVGIPLGEVALNADVLVPGDGATVRAGAVAVTGYAFAGGERYVARVDVSADGGQTWQQADLGEDLGRWAWRLWSTDVELTVGTHELVVRAWDSAAATQPEDPASVWNPKGYVNNAWGRITVTARRAELSGALENLLEHPGPQQSGGGVLAARVVAAQEGEAAGQRVLGTVAEARAWWVVEQVERG